MKPEDLALKLAALEKEVTLLRAEIEATRGGRAPTLRASGRCPACGGTNAIFVPEVLEQAHGGGLVPLAIAQKTSWWGSNRSAPLSAYACTACGWVEWYVSTFEGIEIDGVKIFYASAERPPEGGPYR
jgi:hypothetical protein